MTAARGLAAARPTFVATVLTGSFLLFLIQPMFARMALPQLGGSSSVWNTAMVFYQATLLAGYAYADRLSRLSIGRQAVAHVGLFLLAALFLPVGLAQWWPAPGATPPTLWLIGLMAVSIGLPFLAVSAQAPLMQRWYSRTGAEDAHDPWFLYAASNIGSLTALIAYPLVIEPAAGLRAQALGWSLGFALLVALIALCARLARHGYQLSGHADGAANAPAPDWRMRLNWLALSAVPSGLMLALTTYLTTDIVAMPMLWVIPLALYLLTFIIAFARRPLIGRRSAEGAALIMLVLGGGLSFVRSNAVPYSVMAALLALVFVTTLALHHRLAASRPDVRHLTGFYFWMSLGGVTGGAFTALAAPLLFSGVEEFPLLLIAAGCLLAAAPGYTSGLRLWLERKVAPVMLDIVLPLVSLGAGFLMTRAVGRGWEAITPVFPLYVFAIVVPAELAAGRRWRYSAHLVVCFLAFGGWRQLTDQNDALVQARSFFGVYRVYDQPDMAQRWLTHGTTLHGVQSLQPALARTPLSYYVAGSGLGQALIALGRRAPNADVALVGLGAGSTLCYRTGRQRWSVYEIDPLVIRIARDPRLFGYVSLCAPAASFIVGDARLNLKAAPAGGYDALIVDAFSSDSIPLHLLTREAIALYRSRLKPGGMLFLHITNRFMDLEPVVARATADLGMTARRYYYTPPPRAARLGATRSDWILLTATPDAMTARLAELPRGASGWTPIAAPAGFAGWTDDHADVLSVLKALR